MRTRKTPNRETFYAVIRFRFGIIKEYKNIQVCKGKLNTYFKILCSVLKKNFDYRKEYLVNTEAAAGFFKNTVKRLTWNMSLTCNRMKNFQRKLIKLFRFSLFSSKLLISN